MSMQSKTSWMMIASLGYLVVFITTKKFQAKSVAIYESQIAQKIKN